MSKIEKSKKVSKKMKKKQGLTIMLWKIFLLKKKC